MSSLAFTALAGISPRALDAALTFTMSQDGEATVQPGDGVHGAALMAEVEDAGLHSAPSCLDSMSGMDETASLRLQMTMDRLSKTMSTLSNLLQMTAATDEAIARSIK